MVQARQPVEKQTLLLTLKAVDVVGGQELEVL